MSRSFTLYLTYVVKQALPFAHSIIVSNELTESVFLSLPPFGPISVLQATTEHSIPPLVPFST